MRQTWFTHDPVNTDTANELLARYAARKTRPERHSLQIPAYGW
jgi:hypothetical protein